MMLHDLSMSCREMGVQAVIVACSLAFNFIQVTLQPLRLINTSLFRKVDIFATRLYTPIMVALLEVDSGVRMRFYGDKALFRNIDTQAVCELEPNDHHGPYSEDAERDPHQPNAKDERCRNGDSRSYGESESDVFDLRGTPGDELEAKNRMDALCAEEEDEYPHPHPHPISAVFASPASASTFASASSKSNASGDEADLVEEKLPESVVSRRKSTENGLTRSDRDSSSSSSSSPLSFGGDNQNVMLISNHCSYMDWMTTFSFAHRFQATAKMRFVLKDVLKYFPGPGWACLLHEYLFVKRSWASDGERMRRKMRSFVQSKTPMWMAIFPEGTFVDSTSYDYLEKCHEFARSRCWPLFNRVCTPRSKGFTMLVEEIQKSAFENVLCDVTLAYTGLAGAQGESPGKGPAPYLTAAHLKNPSRRLPTLSCLLNGTPPEFAHVHMRAERVADALRRFGGSSDWAEKWLVESFKEKDRLLAYFEKHQRFPGSAWEAPVHPLTPNLVVAAWFILFIVPYALARVVFGAMVVNYAMLGLVGVIVFGQVFSKRQQDEAGIPLSTQHTK